MTTTAIDHPKLLADIDAAIGTATKADVGFLETLILDRLDDGRLTMKTTHRLLLQLRRRWISGGGLCRITRDGSVARLDVGQGSTLRDNLWPRVR
jgi:hypothetical protein